MLNLFPSINVDTPSQAGIPVPTEITQKVLTGAQHIGKGNTDVPGFEVPSVEDLLWGQTVSGERNSLSLAQTD